MNKYYSDDRQDEFVANLLGFKRNGHYLDIGSCSSVGSNNSYFFEWLDWRGICIEKDPHFNDSYKTRTCKYINMDAREVDYKALLVGLEFPVVIDYLSLDVDDASTDVLLKLPLTEYCFRAITIEHDSHVYGDKYKGPQREILTTNGYHLLCSDVLNQSGRNIGQDHAWEDWWINPNCFDIELIERLQSHRLTTGEIISKFK